MIDLHTHSTASDGTFPPADLADLAADKQLTAIALTDHDTVAGVAAAQARGRERGVEVVAGVELSIQRDGAGAMHILGYFIDPEHAELLERLEELRGHRQARARRIVERLNSLGVGVSYERVAELAGAGSVGRPHIARAMLEAEAVKSIDAAFSRYLSKGKPAYVQKVQFRADEALRLVRAAGGVTVLAHPTTLKLRGAALRRAVEELKGWGLVGIEVQWSGHNAAERESYAALAERLDLVATGGTDFHGATKPGIELGTGRRGNVAVEDSVLSALRNQRPAT